MTFGVDLHRQFVAISSTRPTNEKWIAIAALVQRVIGIIPSDREVQRIISRRRDLLSTTRTRFCRSLEEARSKGFSKYEIESNLSRWQHMKWNSFHCSIMKDGRRRHTKLKLLSECHVQPISFQHWARSCA
jgi:hypothetical protein